MEEHFLQGVFCTWESRIDSSKEGIKLSLDKKLVGVESDHCKEVVGSNKRM